MLQLIAAPFHMSVKIILLTTVYLLAIPSDVAWLKETVPETCVDEVLVPSISRLRYRPRLDESAKAEIDPLSDSKNHYADYSQRTACGSFCTCYTLTTQHA